MTFDEWWKEMKPAEVDDLKPQFEDCWARAQIADNSVVGVPQGYEPHEIPADYTGPLFLEGQMRQAHATGKREMYCGSAQMMREIERLRADNMALRMALRGMVDTADRVDLDRPVFGECKAMRAARAALADVDG